MRFRTAAVLAGALLITRIEVPVADSAQDTPAQSVVMLRLVRDIAEEHGTAVLIRQDRRGSETVLHFLTSSRLFRIALEDGRSAARTIELLLDGQDPLKVERADVSMASAGGCVDIAVFRVTTPVPTALVPQRVIYDAPHAGGSLLILGFDRAGGSTQVAAIIRFRSTLMAIADRDVSSLRGCVGAPAVVAAAGGWGVFGVINECQPNRPPVISLLSAARHFIERYQ